MNELVKRLEVLFNDIKKFENPSALTIADMDILLKEFKEELNK